MSSEWAITPATTSTHDPSTTDPPTLGASRLEPTAVNRIEENKQPGELKDLAASFKLLADETRLRVLRLLIESGELNVRTLCEHLKQSQPAVSHHLALLREAGVIKARLDGKHNFYHCVADRLETIIDDSWRDVIAQNAAPSAIVDA